MLSINADGLDHRELNEALRSAERSCRIESCLGQRFIAAGMADKDIMIQGVPGNALGAYLNGSTVTVQGNAQDAVGDTMNAGTIVIHVRTPPRREKETALFERESVRQSELVADG